MRMPNKAQPRKVYRSTKDRVIAGVCGGLGKYFDVDPLILRILFVLLAAFGGSGILIYIILWIVIPEENEPARPGDLEQIFKKGANKMAEEIKDAEPERKRNGRLVGGLIFLLIGFIFLIQNVFPSLGLDFDKLWPVILIVIGVGILRGKK